MHHHYKDIIDRISDPPIWWDEYAVPRFEEFEPGDGAYIYADEVALLHVQCQGCGHDFRVCMSTSKTSRINLAESSEDNTVYWSSLEEIIKARTIHYGDPPNFCCAAGATMNSIPRRVLGYWRRSHLDWIRITQNEIDINPEWGNVA